MSCRFPLLALLAILSATLHAASPLFSWHTAETQMPVRGKRFDIVLHSRLRTQKSFSYLDQARAGSILRWNAAPHLIPYGGFYFQPQQTRPHDFTKGWRFFGGVEAPFQLKPSLRLTTRLAAEHFVHTGRPDYNRYRSFERLVIGKGRIAPYLQNEFIAVRQGFHSMRNSGGLRLQLSTQLMLEASYLFDTRRTVWGGDRQAIITSLQWRPLAR